METGFISEEFSLHYQRSLFSAMTSLVRETVQSIDKKSSTLPPDVQETAKEIAAKRETLLFELKKIYRKKFDVLKIRIHGDMGLRHVLLTGKDLLIHDFGGNPLKPFSERRLKRSPLRDVAAMIHSLYYASYKGFMGSAHIAADDLKSLLPFADLWAHYMSNFFIKAYQEETKGFAFIPEEKEDMDTLITCYLIERSLQWLNYELNHNPKKAALMVKVTETIIRQHDI